MFDWDQNSWFERTDFCNGRSKLIGRGWRDSLTQSSGGGIQMVRSRVLCRIRKQILVEGGLRFFRRLGWGCMWSTWWRFCLLYSWDDLWERDSDEFWRKNHFWYKTYLNLIWLQVWHFHLFVLGSFRFISIPKQGIGLLGGSWSFWMREMEGSKFI